MKTIDKILVLISFGIALGAGNISNAQISISVGSDGKSRTFLAGAFELGADVLTNDSKAFTCAPVRPLKKGAKVSAMTSEDQAWSVAKHSFKVGEKNVRYPVVGMAKCSDGNFQRFIAATTTVKVDIKAGEVLHSDGFQIEAKKDIKAGESFPTIIVGDSPMSIEPAPQAKDDTAKPKPCLTIFKDDVKPNARSVSLEAWGISKEHSE